MGSTHWEFLFFFLTEWTYPRLDRLVNCENVAAIQMLLLLVPAPCIAKRSSNPPEVIVQMN